MVNSHQKLSARKAAPVTAMFGIFGLFFLVKEYKVLITTPASSLPIVCLYALLLWNTFFSIRVFANITPSLKENPFVFIVQFVIDLYLIALYFLLASSLDNPFAFLKIATGLFIAATLKYIAFTQGHRTPYMRLLKKKISIDSFGIVIALIFWLLYSLYNSNIIVWVLCILFALANIYLILIKPLYVLE